jgi:hypothetical protein
MHESAGQAAASRSRLVITASGLGQLQLLMPCLPHQLLPAGVPGHGPVACVNHVSTSARSSFINQHAVLPTLRGGLQ